MLAGILSRRLAITCLLLFASIVVNAQFSHRFEVLAGASFPYQLDKINISQGYISFSETTKRAGTGTLIGIKYNLKDFPVSLLLGYEINKLSDYSIISNLNVFEQSQELHMKSVDLDIHYLFFHQSTFKPYVVAGLNFNNLDYTRRGVSYDYNIPSDDGYIQTDHIVWGYDLIQSSFYTFGFNMGTGVNIRLTDKIGINGNVKWKYIPQNQTNWLDNQLLIRSFSMGIYYRLLKRKNNLSL